MARRKDRTRQECGMAASIGEPGDRMEDSGRAGAVVPIFRTATYARLSVSGGWTESDSISSQQMLMRNYIRGKEEFFLVKEYQDDGASGTGFDRRAFGCLLEEVRKGNINCIVVKDFSRFGRNHIEVGDYLERIFPFLGVRFISINDGYDSFDRECENIIRTDKSSLWIFVRKILDFTPSGAVRAVPAGKVPAEAVV